MIPVATQWDFDKHGRLKWKWRPYIKTTNFVLSLLRRAYSHWLAPAMYISRSRHKVGLWTDFTVSGLVFAVTTSLHIFLVIWMTLIFKSSLSSYEKTKISVPIISRNSRSVRAKTGLLSGDNDLFGLDLHMFRGENSAGMILWNINLTLSCVKRLVNRFVSNLI